MPTEYQGPGGAVPDSRLPLGSESAAFRPASPHSAAPPPSLTCAAPPVAPAAAVRAGAGPASAPAAPEIPFGAALEPVLRRACEGRLSAVTWFRTDWQRGGALTGYATYRDAAGAEQPVVVKLPVPPGERHWLVRLQDAGDVAPRVLAHGESLNGYDMAWVVLERLGHGPLGGAWGGKEFDLLVEAAGRFYAAARSVPPTPPPARDWAALLDQARQHLKRHDVHDEQRWARALKQLHKVLPEWLRIWGDRPADQWCHGDLHLGNAMTRTAPPAGPALLFDFAQTHTGHWVEDGVYFEHLFWARRQRLGDRKLCKLLAHQRKALGLPVSPDWPRLATIRRGLIAMGTPAMLQYDGARPYVQAALEVLEASLAQG